MCIFIKYIFAQLSLKLSLKFLRLPSYMKDVLKFDIKSNGLMSALPYLACALVTTLSAVASSFLVQKKILSRLNVIRLFTALGLLVPMAALLCIAFVNCSKPYLAVIGLVVAVGFK